MLPNPLQSSPKFSFFINKFVDLSLREILFELLVDLPGFENIHVAREHFSASKSVVFFVRALFYNYFVCTVNCAEFLANLPNVEEILI